MKKYPTSIGALLLIVAFISSARSEEKPTQERLDQVVAKIQTAYEKIGDLRSDFTQTVRFKDFETPYLSKGRLFLKKGKMRWDYQEPSRQQIFVDGERVLYYIPEHKQIIKSRLGGESDSHLPLRLLAGTGRLDQSFQISFEGEASPSQKSISLRLIPKNGGTQLTHIIATVAPSPSVEGLIIQKVVLYEENGNVSLFSFEGIEINKGLSEDIFNFKIPKGIEIIESP